VGELVFRMVQFVVFVGMISLISAGVVSYLVTGKAKGGTTRRKNPTLFWAQIVTGVVLVAVFALVYSGLLGLLG
jgi:hypothetical protein